MKRDLEALLLATEAPLGLARLRALFPEATPAQIREAVAELKADYEAAGHAFTVVEFGGGWQVATRPEYAGLVHRLYGGRRTMRLSKAGLEVLAIIAYRQPLTRLEIDEIRGVQSSGALATLLERNLITVVGRAETVGHPILYGTTREFLNHLGLQGLHQLPQLPELGRLMDDREGFKQFALQLGQELSDSDLADWDGEPGAAPGGEEGAATPQDVPDGPPDGGPESVADAEPGAAAEAAAVDADGGLGAEPDDEFDDEPDDEPGEERG